MAAPPAASCECLEGPIAAGERAIGGLSVGVPGAVAATAR